MWPEFDVFSLLSLNRKPFDGTINVLRSCTKCATELGAVIRLSTAFFRLVIKVDF